MQTLDPHLVQANAERRKAVRELLTLRAQRARRAKAGKGKLAQVNEYRLVSNGQATDELKRMTHPQAQAENQARRARFIAHVNACLDAGTPTTEHLTHWKCHRHHTQLQND